MLISGVVFYTSLCRCDHAWCLIKGVVLITGPADRVVCLHSALIVNGVFMDIIVLYTLLYVAQTHVRVVDGLAPPPL